MNQRWSASEAKVKVSSRRGHVLISQLPELFRSESPGDTPPDPPRPHGTAPRRRPVTGKPTGERRYRTGTTRRPPQRRVTERFSNRQSIRPRDPLPARDRAGRRAPAPSHPHHSRPSPPTPPATTNPQDTAADTRPRPVPSPHSPTPVRKATRAHRPRHTPDRRGHPTPSGARGVGARRAGLSTGLPDPAAEAATSPARPKNFQNRPFLTVRKAVLSVFRRPSGRPGRHGHRSGHTRVRAARPGGRVRAVRKG